MSMYRMSICCDSIAILLVLLSADLCNSQNRPAFEDNCSKYGQTCVNHFSCSNARALINSKQALPCGFRDEVLKKDVKICCSSSNIIPPPSSRNSTAVVLQKCQEYGKYRYVKKFKQGDIPGDKGIEYNQQDCVNVQTLIIGGTPAKAKEYPHMAVIGFGKELKSVTWDCGGSLISEKFVMSAAHCGGTTETDTPRWVLLGDLTLSSAKDDAKPKVYSIVKIHNHPNYKSPSVYHDISLFELNTTVAFSPYVRPACLYTQTADLPAGSKASITGWGRTGVVERTSDKLLKATISVTSHQNCKTTFEVNPVKLARGYDSNTMICAGDTEKGRDTCPGDSGGPLQILIPNEVCMWNIIGVTSFGPGICGNNEEPGVYTKVSYYLDWIQSIVWP